MGFRFYKIGGISLLPEDFLASQEGLACNEFRVTFKRVC